MLLSDRHEEGQVALTGSRKAAAEPLRRCLASGRQRPAEQMLRFVIGPDEAVVPDFARRLPGRGLWLSAEAAIVRRAVDKNLFAKAARRQVKVAPDLAQQVADTARERFLAQLGIAKRAGALVSGYEAVLSAVRHRQAKLLIEAADGAETGRQRLRAAAGDAIGTVDSFSAQEMGRALGRDIAVHLAVTEQRWADSLTQRAALALALDQGGAAEG